MENMLTWSFGLVGLVGTILTIYFGLKAARLEREKKTLEWADILMAADDLASSIRRTYFVPDLIFAPAVRGGMIGELISESINLNVPVVLGFTEWRESGLFSGDLSAYDSFDTGKWRVHIPLSVYKNSERKVLIVDDLVMSGDSLFEIRSRFEANGFQRDNIRTAAVVATKVAKHNHKGPDHCWKETESTDFFFPWGKAK